MKKIAIDLQDLIDVLVAMRDSGGTTQVVIFEHNGLPTLCDKDDPENIIQFQVFDKEQETKNGDPVH